jgi:hypothetical protein
MLGDVTSESPRAPSPWDELLQTSTPPTAITVGTPPLLPKLVPEVEQGSIEYKLKLCEFMPFRTPLVCH